MSRLFAFCFIISAAVVSSEKLKCHQCSSEDDATCSDTGLVAGNAFLKECKPSIIEHRLTLKLFASKYNCIESDSLESCQQKWSKPGAYQVEFVDALSGNCASSDSVHVCGEKLTNVTTFKFTYPPIYCRKQSSSSKLNELTAL